MAKDKSYQDTNITKSQKNSEGGGGNLKKTEISMDDFCKESGEEEETVEHLLPECPALENMRSQTLRQNYFNCRKIT